MIENIRDILLRYSQKKEFKKTLVASRVLELWHTCLLEHGLAKYSGLCQAISYRDKILTVEVKGSALAGELRMSEENLRQSLNKKFNTEAVERIYWRIL